MMDLATDIWRAWTHLYPTVPYWNPYGAILTLLLGVVLLGYLVKLGMGRD